MKSDEKKKHKLLLIIPSGEEYNLGFLSPCKDGIVLGTSKVEDVDTSHLTIIVKGETLSSHITPQDGTEERQFFPSLGIKDIGKKLQTIVDDKLIAPLSAEEISLDLIFFTKKFRNWLNTIQNTLYQKKVSSKEVIHIFNFKKLLEKVPELIERITKSPSSYFGLCKASQILEDKSKIIGFTETGLLVIPFENHLYTINLPLLTDFTFEPSLQKADMSTPLDEIYRSMGIPQYMKEIENKKFLEKIFFISYFSPYIISFSTRKRNT